MLSPLDLGFDSQVGYNKFILFDIIYYIDVNKTNIHICYLLYFLIKNVYHIIYSNTYN